MILLRNEMDYAAGSRNTVTDNTPSTGGEVALQDEVIVQPPRLYRVLMHNDNYTTMEFVVDILKRVFLKPEDDAIRIMLNIHQQGIGHCGVYTADVAESKIRDVHKSAQDAGYPLRCSMEPE